MQIPSYAVGATGWGTVKLRGGHSRLAVRRVILSTMEQTNLVLLFKLFTVLAMALWVLVFWRPSKGGRPPRPMHPSPADDTVLLWKRRKRKYSG